MTKQNIKTKVDGKYMTFGNIIQGDRGPRLGLKMSEQFKKMVADAPLDSYLNFLVFNDDRNGDAA